jgi:hypothetical protein
MATQTQLSNDILIELKEMIIAEFFGELANTSTFKQMCARVKSFLIQNDITPDDVKINHNPISNDQELDIFINNQIYRIIIR